MKVWPCRGYCRIFSLLVKRGECIFEKSESWLGGSKQAECVIARTVENSAGLGHEVHCSDSPVLSSWVLVPALSPSRCTIDHEHMMYLFVPPFHEPLLRKILILSVSSRPSARFKLSR